MAHFGVLSFKGTGHLNPLIALSRTLIARGHRVTFFQEPELEARICAFGPQFCAVGGASRRVDKFMPHETPHRDFSDISKLRSSVLRMIEDVERSLRETPEALARAGVDALILDEIVLSGPTLAQLLCLPYFIISTSVPHHFGWDVPDSLGQADSRFRRMQRALLEVSILRMRGPVRRRLDQYRRERGLESIRTSGRKHRELAHITQLPQCLDFPRQALSHSFHYAGPLTDEKARAAVEFPWEQLDGRPIVYASLGTAWKSGESTFRVIAEACSGLDVQLVISLGGRQEPESLQDLPGRPLIVKDAPQLELLRRAALVITHAGLNTALETLLQGKPMIAIPAVFDQPAVAARLVQAGVAIALPTERLSPGLVRSAVAKILGDPRYRAAAVKMQSNIRAVDGLKRAADVLEKSMANFAAQGRASSSSTRSS